MVIAAFPYLGCESIDPAVEVPSYISIDAFDLKTDYSTEGTDDHKITDVWVIVDDSSIGAYELPANIPILAGGTSEIRLFGGIQINGIASTRTIYPFFDDTIMSVSLVPGSTVDLTPQISYYPDLTFDWLEDFEIGSTIQTGFGSDTALKLEYSGAAAMGAQSAVIHVDATNDYYLGETSGKQFALPKGLPIYLELHYASNIEFSIGVIKNTATGAIIAAPYFNVYPSNEWNKIYVNLTEYIMGQTDALTFEIYFSCEWDPLVADNTVRLDNIKLIYN